MIRDSLVLSQLGSFQKKIFSESHTVPVYYTKDKGLFIKIVLIVTDTFSDGKENKAKIKNTLPKRKATHG